MPLVVTNSLSGKKEVFTPLKPGEVSMYVCGPTVYGYTHVGNARPVVVFDVVRRFLEFSGYRVKFVSNYTDVDDKIINRARDEKIDWTAVVAKYVEAFETDLKALKVKPVSERPRVTTHIPEILKFIEGLIANGSAYVADDGEVFFAIRKFAEYGKLSNKKIDDLRAGARIEPDERKLDPLDFSLWKPRKAEGEPAWPSPWSEGRPGWHIECSAMALKHLGETFDIHGGGLDLIHPHHENEVAQSEALTKKPFAKYWLHNNMVSIGSEKMSKSLGNIFTTRDFIRQYSAETLRYLLLSNHYRSLVDFSETHIKECQAALHRIYSAIEKVATLPGPAGAVVASEEQKKLAEFRKSFRDGWIQALNEDFNTAKAISLVFEYVRLVNAYVDKKGTKPAALDRELLSGFAHDVAELGEVLNLFREEPTSYLALLRSGVLSGAGLNEAWVKDQIEKRNAARAAKDWPTSDQIRKECLDRGVELKDTPAGTVWDVKF